MLQGCPRVSVHPRLMDPKLAPEPPLRLTLGARQYPLHDRSRAVLVLAVHVRIDIRRRRNLRVAEPLRHRRQIHPGGQERGRGMAERVRIEIASELGPQLRSAVVP